MDLKTDLTKLIKQVYVWAGRPTKDGADLLRNLAAEIEHAHTLYTGNVKPVQKALVPVFYDRKNNCEVRSIDIRSIDLVKYRAGIDNEGYSQGTPIKTLTDKYGEETHFIVEEVVSEFGYKSSTCLDSHNWDNHCNYSDLVFLRFE